MSRRKNGKIGVVVTTEHRGVFFGYINPDDINERSIRVEQCRMCVRWETSNRGVVGLAATGPDSAAKITPAAPAIVLHDVTSVMECSKAAVKAWESEPWN